MTSSLRATTEPDPVAPAHLCPARQGPTLAAMVLITVGVLGWLWVHNTAPPATDLADAPATVDERERYVVHVHGVGASHVEGPAAGSWAPAGAHRVTEGMQASYKLGRPATVDSTVGVAYVDPEVVGGDPVIVALDGAAAEAVTGSLEARSGGGYSLMGAGIGIDASYRIRLVTNHARAGELSSPMGVAASQLRSHTGADIAVGPSMGSLSNNRGVISVQVGDVSPCGGAWAGCTAVYTQANRITHVHITIRPTTLSMPHLRNIVIHELGHGMGLNHFSGTFGGQLQLMNQMSQAGLHSLRSGDVNGLRQVVRNGFGNGYAPGEEPVPPGRPNRPRVSPGVRLIDISWSAPSAGTSPIDRYEVHREGSGTALLSPSARSHRSTGLDPASSYRYRVRARNAHGWGSWSSWSYPVSPWASCVAGIVDVGAHHTFCGSIGWLVDNGVTAGWPDGTFRPTASVSRQAMAAFLYRMAGSPNGSDPTCSTAPFADVARTHPFCGEIRWLVNAGIAEGFADRTFRPSGLVTRQAMAAFMHRAAGSPETTGGTRFADVPVGRVFEAEIRWMAVTGISEGWPDGTFRPSWDVTRQAMAAFLQRFGQVT